MNGKTVIIIIEVSRHHQDGLAGGVQAQPACSSAHLPKRRHIDVIVPHFGGSKGGKLSNYQQIIKRLFCRYGFGEPDDHSIGREVNTGGQCAGGA